MIICPENYSETAIGSKARNLFLLREAGFPVPPFFCVENAFGEEEVLDRLAEGFPDTASFSVRSCASLEDSAGYSFAGQFRTFLGVPREDVCARIRDVLADAAAPEHISYCETHRLDSSALTMHVMIQEMVEADLAGVLFTANPQGILNESVIVCGRGTGDGIVEDKTDATTYYYNLSDQSCYYEQVGESPLLTDTQIKELIRSSQQIKELFELKTNPTAEMQFDIEFAIKEDTLYFLQVRPVTTFDHNAPVIILDNSNIVESYPGITLPLTQSFIREAYYQVFKNLLIRLTEDADTVKGIDETLKYMVDMANGRVYYRISNWYDVLLFLPFHRYLIPIWQEMMGVKTKTVTSSLKEPISFSTRLKVTRSFFSLLRTCPKEMEALDQYFRKITDQFNALDRDTDDNRILLDHYHRLQDMTVRKWDMTLVNDMYGFLYTGLLKACLRAKRVPDHALAANRAICGIQKLESMRPIEALRNLAEQAKNEDLLSELEGIDSNEAYFQYIHRKDTAFSLALQAYILEFGDRNVEELKLESRTFRTDPVLLIRCILQYAEASSDTALPCHTQDSPSSDTAAPRLTGLAAFFAKRAAVGIRNRERSRLHRGRLYGMMRSLVLQMGQNLYAEDRIRQPEDVFWLYCSEIEAAASDGSTDLRRIISERKRQYEGFSRLPACSRLVFSGKVTDKAPKESRKVPYSKTENVFYGTPCSPGCVTGEALIVEHPSPALDTKGKILITKMTDPGWVFLIAQAKAILSEKGSLLSHTAIISRELGKPSVVGLDHITEYLKTGDTVCVNGDAGVVTVITASYDT
ncbi:MAG: phosphoenolpyruvate synthase [Lachnospiraceae bacterium]|nr:phosphoenolpyruvate synthase [Lachnospiraceae bacterium]